MVAIKKYRRSYGYAYVVLDGVCKDRNVSPDGIFEGRDIWLGEHIVSDNFLTLEEAKEAKAAYEEYAKKYFSRRR